MRNFYIEGRVSYVFVSGTRFKPEEIWNVDQLHLPLEIRVKENTNVQLLTSIYYFCGIHAFYFRF